MERVVSHVNVGNSGASSLDSVTIVSSFCLPLFILLFSNYVVVKVSKKKDVCFCTLKRVDASVQKESLHNFCLRMFCDSRNCSAGTTRKKKRKRSMDACFENGSFAVTHCEPTVEVPQHDSASCEEYLQSLLSL